MADVKAAVTATAKPVAKAVATTKAAETKKEEVKTTTAKKAPATKTTPAKKAPAAKTTTAKKATTTTKKVTPEKKETAAAPAKEVVNFQFAGKSYTTEDLMKIAKDVWQYDLNKKLSDFDSCELYVKPEENTAYYVINEEVTGSFGI